MPKEGVRPFESSTLIVSAVDIFFEFLIIDKKEKAV
jgi:hypothetical protein